MHKTPSKSKKECRRLGQRASEWRNSQSTKRVFNPSNCLCVIGWKPVGGSHVGERQKAGWDNCITVSTQKSGKFPLCLNSHEREYCSERLLSTEPTQHGAFAIRCTAKAGLSKYSYLKTTATMMCNICSSIKYWILLLLSHFCISIKETAKPDFTMKQMNALMQQQMV